MKNQFQQQFFNLLDLMIRQVAREEAQFVLREQSKLTEAKGLSLKSSGQEILTYSYESKGSAKWLLPYEGINIFHSVLLDKEKLYCSLEDFNSIFLTPDANPVRWCGKNGELACLLGTFHSRNVVSTSESYWPTLTSFFYHSDNEKFSHASLCSQYSQSQYSADFENLLIEIIQRLKSEFKNSSTGVKSG